MPCGRSVLIQCTYNFNTKSALVKYRFVHEATHHKIEREKEIEQIRKKKNKIMRRMICLNGSDAKNAFDITLKMPLSVDKRQCSFLPFTFFVHVLNTRKRVK